jgi:hypothetical protein
VILQPVIYARPQRLVPVVRINVLLAIHLAGGVHAGPVRTGPRIVNSREGKHNAN